MDLGLRILQMADNDVDETARFIGQGSIDHMLRFYDAVNATYKKILRTPKRWPIYGLSQAKWRDVRKIAIEGFSNYLVFYRIDADMLEIIRVLHGARDIPTLFDEMT